MRTLKKLYDHQPNFRLLLHIVYNIIKNSKDTLNFTIAFIADPNFLFFCMNQVNSENYRINTLHTEVESITLSAMS